MTEAVCNASALIFGPSKAGKTHFLASGPKPVLILDAEGGSRFLPFKKIIWSNTMNEPPEYDGSWEVCIVYVRDFSTLESVYTWLHSGKHPFRTVCIDSISEAQQRCVDSIAGVKQMTTPDWGNLLRRISALVRSYRDLLIHPLNPVDCVAFTAMEKINQDGVHSPYLQGAIANVISYYVDLALYLRAEPNPETGAIERKLLTKPHPLFLAGDRTGRLPNVMINASLEDVLVFACDINIEQGETSFPDIPPAGDEDDVAAETIFSASVAGDTTNKTEETST